MKKKVLVLLVTVIALMSAMCFGAGAETYYPDESGRYTVELSMEAGHEYVMFLLKGEYDQTNYIEALDSSADEDIIYFGTAISDSDGKVTFGPFAPFEYCNATVIVGGTSLAEPYLAGHVNADGFTSAAFVEITNVDGTYYVDGALGEDIVIKVQTQVIDSFGNPSLTNENVVISANDNGMGYVTADEENSTVTISRMSESMVFSIKAEVGNASDIVHVTVSRNGDVAHSVAITSEDGETVYESPYTCSYVAGNLPTLVFGAKNLDQFGEATVLGGSITYTFDGKPSTNTVTPSGAGTYVFTASNEAGISASLEIEFVEIPDYQGYAKELDELIKAAEAELALVLEGKNGKYVSSLNGGDVYPSESWTTPDDVADMEYAIEDMKDKLAKYGEETDNYFHDAATTFNTCCLLFKASFKAGKRVDATSVTITSANLDKIDKQSKPITLTYRTLPASNTDVLTWTSSDPSIVSVDGDGRITTNAYGTATITATTRLGISDSVDVTVWNEITRLEVTSNITVTYGDPYKSFTAVAYTVDSSNPPSAKIEWVVDNPEVAQIKVSEDGKTGTVIPVGKGTANVTVSADALSVTRKITVNLPADWITPASPVSDVESGIIYKGTKVALSTETDGASIYYTLNGEEPTLENSRLYREPIAINQNLTIKAFATGEKMFNSAVSTYEYTVVSPAIVMDNITAQAGETVDVDVYFVDNPGISELAFEIGFDTQYLTLTNAKFEEGVTGRYSGIGVYSVSATSIDSENSEVKLATITFEINKGIPEADYALSAKVTTESDNELYGLIAYNGGVITVDNVIVGDADDNGRIEISDVLLIRQYIAGMQAAKNRISFIGADVNADGAIDEDDVVLLSKYCVGLDVTLGSQAVAKGEL